MRNHEDTVTEVILPKGSPEYRIFDVKRVFVSNIGFEYRKQTNILQFDKIIHLKDKIRVELMDNATFGARILLYRIPPGFCHSLNRLTFFMPQDIARHYIESHIMYYLSLIYNLFPNCFLFLDNIETVKMEMNKESAKLTGYL